MRSGPRPKPVSVPKGRVPRISRLMALAIRFEKLVREGRVDDYAELARRGQVTRARLTQIVNLLHLAPDIQEQILFLPNASKGFGPVVERDLRKILSIADWAEQRRAWGALTAAAGNS